MNERPDTAVGKLGVKKCRVRFVPDLGQGTGRDFDPTNIKFHREKEGEREKEKREKGLRRRRSIYPLTVTSIIPRFFRASPITHPVLHI